MLLRGLVAASLLASGSQAIPQATRMTPEKLIKTVPAVEPEQPDVVFQNYPLVKRIDCIEGRGTGFRIGGQHMLSVAHVAGLTACVTDGVPLALTEKDVPHDFARVETGYSTANGFKIDCGGFIPGRWYWAIGHAHGEGFQTAVAIWATIYRVPDGKRILVGMHTVVPGMSGGPIVDAQTGAVVGTVNAYTPNDNLSLSRELKDTSICGGHDA